MTVRDAMILGLVTIVGSGLMFCYVSGFEPTVVKVTSGITVGVLALFLFMAKRKGLFKKPDNK